MAERIKEASTIFGIAFAATCEAMLGNWFGRALSFGAVALGYAGLYIWLGDAAVSSILEAAIFLILVPLLVFGLVFVWNLWMAPYRKIARDVGAIAGKIDLIAQTVLNIDERAKGFEESANQRLEAHMKAVSDGWSALEENLGQAVDGPIQGARRSFERLEKEIAAKAYDLKQAEGNAFVHMSALQSEATEALRELEEFRRLELIRRGEGS